MKIDKDTIWIGGKDLEGDKELIEQAALETSLPAADSPLPMDIDESTSGNRRDFLKILGFSVGAAAVAGCEIPVKRAIPYVVKPDAIVPGVATYYASTFVHDGDVLPIIVKTREGRPIKIEGNSMSSMSRGGTSARAQASVLDLYDIDRIREPYMRNDEEGAEWKATDWASLDRAIQKALSSSSRPVLLTHTIVSPSSLALIDKMIAKYPGMRHVQYDAISSSALLQANKEDFGEALIPDYHFDKADVIASFGADFLGTWISPVEYAADYAERRKVRSLDDHRMSRHFQIEAGMSMTGSNADNRIPVRPSHMGSAIAYLHGKIAGGGGGSALPADAKKGLDVLADNLKAARGKSIVISNSNNKAEQKLVNAINARLGNYGSTMTFAHASLQRKGNDKDLRTLMADISAGRVDALITWGANPAYDTPEAAQFVEKAAGIKTKIALAYKKDETTLLADYVAPIHHTLESWGDAEPKRGLLSTIQPTISPLFTTRQAEESLMIWSEGVTDEVPDYRTFVQMNWKNTAFGAQTSFGSFDTFWENALQDGVVELSGGTELNYGGSASASGITRPSSDGLEISFTEKVGLGDGSYANNPWLQEMPDPVTRCSWGNYLAVPVTFDGDRKFVGYGGVEDDSEVVELAVGDYSISPSAIKQFGQKADTVSIALGYGRSAGGTCAKGIGVNLYPALTVDSDGNTQYYATDVDWKGSTGRKEKYYSSVQYHHTMGVTGIDSESGEKINADEQALADLPVKGFQGSLVNRSIIRRAHADELGEFIHDLQHEREHHQHLNDASLYPGHDELYNQGHHWGMHIDLNACIGCSACSVACMAENNVPVVGKREVSRHHEMTWLRIDRYYYGDVENPKTVYQPMMCQHCDNAPCENVCPVNATNHSSEGLNQMAYNRCVGTRYCANNCPYKVRRFNWLDYTTADTWPDNEPVLVEGTTLEYGADDLTRMVLNPDVTVRSRGVIEKCSFCAQRIQEGKLTAKKEGRRLRDADVKTACQTACPTGAIVFGDRNNPEGDLMTKYASPLNYIALEEVNVQSSVQYSARINNQDKKLEA